MLDAVPVSAFLSDSIWGLRWQKKYDCNASCSVFVWLAVPERKRYKIMYI